MNLKFKKPLLIAACVTMALGISSCGKSKQLPKDSSTPQIEGYNLLWSDEFNGTKLDSRLWNREVREAGWTNEELQAYVTDEANGFIRDGKFVIKGIEHEDGTYTSCKLNTHGKADFLYGRVEVSAKVPYGKGLWPAIWMMPEVEEVYGQWPKCGEIDIMEVLGDNVQKAYSTIHYGEPHAEQQGVLQLAAGSYAKDFHTFAVDWEPGLITWYIDNKQVLQVNDWFTAVDGEDEKEYPAPFNQKFGIQINLAIGGTWPGNPEPGAYYMDVAEFEIDYVRVYQKPSYDTNVSKPEKVFRHADETGNFIMNSDFSDDTEDLTDEVGWQYKNNEGGKGAAVIENGVMKITTEEVGSTDYSIQLVHHEMPFFQGHKYKITYDMWSDEERDVNEVCVDAPNAGWSRYWKQSIKLTTEPKTFTDTFTLYKKDDNAARFEFNMGKTDSKATIYIDNVRVEDITDN